MDSTLLFLVLALVIIVLPMVARRCLALKGLVPIAVVQIMVGIAMGPSVFGRVAPEFYHMFANPASLSALSGVSTIAVLLFGLTIGLHLGPDLFRDKVASSLSWLPRISQRQWCWVFRAGSGSWFVILRNS